MISNFLKNLDRSFVLSLEYSILVLVVFYFVILFFSEYKTLGLNHPIIEIPQQLKQINEVALYVMDNIKEATTLVGSDDAVKKCVEITNRTMARKTQQLE